MTASGSGGEAMGSDEEKRAFLQRRGVTLLPGTAGLAASEDDDDDATADGTGDAAAASDAGAAGASTSPGDPSSVPAAQSLAQASPPPPPSTWPSGSTTPIPPPSVHYGLPDGTTVYRRFDGVTTYKFVTTDQLAAQGYRFWINDGGLDKWVKTDSSSEIHLQLAKVNKATSEQALARLQSLVATRKQQLDDIAEMARQAKSADPDVAAEAQKELQELQDEFPGFDDDYALVSTLREQVDAEHRPAFETQVKALVEQRDRWDPQSGTP